MEEVRELTGIAEETSNGLFQKYHSLINHYDEKSIAECIAHNPWVVRDLFVVYEKLHGGNFSIIITREGAHYCSRNTLFETLEGCDYFGFSELGHEYDELIEAIRKELLNEKTEIRYVTLYGELYGKGIQKGVDYGDGKRLAFFDMSANGRLLSQAMFLGYMRELGFEHMLCPIQAEGVTYEEARAIPNDLSSLISPNGDIREGNVIKPLNTPYLGNFRPFYIKDKNDKFKEKQRRPREHKVDVELERLVDTFLVYVNENRFMNVCSKHGFPQSNKDIGTYVKLLLEDATEEFLHEHPEFAKYANLKRGIGKCGAYCIPYIRKHMGS